MSQLRQIVDRLCSVSREDQIRAHELAWPQTLDKHQWFTSPELISAYGSQEWEALSENRRQLLSFYEAVNFYSLNIHGEKPLVQGLAQRVYRADTADITAYLHHFLEEENKHMVYFGGFCMRYAGKVYADKKLSFPRDTEDGEEDFLFFARVLIFEEIADAFNLRMAGDSRLHPLARTINQLHHKDESRHLVFGRKFVIELFQRYRNSWSPDTVQGISDYLKAYLQATWREYYNPDVYADAGLPDSRSLPQRFYNAPAQKQLRKRLSAGCVSFLMTNGIIDKEPGL